MSESSAPVSPHDVGTHTHPSSPSKSGTSLLDFPPNATLQIWRRPNGKGTVDPVEGGSVHVSELIPGDGNHVLVCFATMATDDWDAICSELSLGDRLGLNPLLVGAVDRVHIASALWGAKAFVSLHGLTNEPTRGTVFSPSQTLMRLLKIDCGHRTRNALILIRNGRVCAEWISRGEGNRPHDWTTILSKVR